MPAVFISETGGNAANSGATFGWQFTVNSSIQVNALGFFDSGQDGIASGGAQVGIFDSGTNLLASATVPAGIVAPLVDQWRYVAIAPLQLLAGQTYVIAGFSSIEVFVTNSLSLTVDPAITYNGGRAGAGVFVFPAISTGPNVGPFGPNFDFGPTSVGVPEVNASSAWAPLTILALFLGSLSSRRSGRQAQGSVA